MSESPREPDPAEAARSIHDPADEPVTGSPAGGAGSPAADASAPGSAGRDSAGSDSATDSATSGGSAGSDAAAGGATSGGSTGGDAGGRPRRRLGTFAPAATGPLDERQRRRRRLFVGGIVAGAAVIVIALCAGLLAVVSAVDGVRDRAGDAREARRLRDEDCRQLEQRLNRLVPPGSTAGPAARATAVRDENSAVRIYLGVLHRQRDEDAWRQLLDARTVYADALDRQAKSRTPAFYVSPRTAEGDAVTGELERWSPVACAGPIHRLAVPEL